MSVKAVTPSDAARHPKHPDHARWVKEQTLKREIDHANAVGLSARAAEDANIILLNRLDARKREAKPAAPKPSNKQRPVTHSELKAAGVKKRAATPRRVVKPPACNYCGLCVKCKRELRMRRIIDSARKGDPQAEVLKSELVALVFAQQKQGIYRDALGRELNFSQLRGLDRAKANTAGIEWICDRSTSFMGEWR